MNIHIFSQANHPLKIRNSTNNIYAEANTKGGRYDVVIDYTLSETFVLPEKSPRERENLTEEMTHLSWNKRGRLSCSEKMK